MFYSACLCECVGVFVCLEFWILSAHVGPACGCVCGPLRGGVWHENVCGGESERERESPEDCNRLEENFGVLSLAEI